MTAAATGDRLPPFTIDWSKPFARETITGESVTLTAWAPQAYSGEQLELPFSLDQISNGGVLAGLTEDQKTFLASHGFVVLHSQEAQFGDIRVETSKRTGQPYYLTGDAAFHALHLLFDELLKSIERDHFYPQIQAITQALVGQIQVDLGELQEPSLQAEAQQALAYLSVALKLLDPQADIDSVVEQSVSEQVAQIMAADGRAYSALFPDFEDDYGAYRPAGHYAGDPVLEAYFRALTWYGRMHFLLQDPSKPDFEPSRLPLIITHALRKAVVDGQPAWQAWAELHQLLTFVIGPSDDAGPLEYAALMDQVYGSEVTIQGFADDLLWQEFLSRADQLPAPQINSLFASSAGGLEQEIGWRFMGQRFTLDGMILQNLIFDRVQAKADGTKREIPSGLDVMAAFGSEPAYLELEKLGADQFPNYADQMAKMQQAVQAQPEEQWLGRFYDSWLSAFLLTLQTKDYAYPAYMQAPTWGYKDLNTALGSWAELKHDTVLYTKMPEMLAGGGPPMSGPAPSYVEPAPAVFYRLAYMARTLSCGLQERVLFQPCDLDGMGAGYPDTAGYIMGMGALGSRFEKLGDIAVKELSGQPLDEGDQDAITACLGMVECLNEDTGYNVPAGDMPEVPVIAAVSGAQDVVLEAGVGKVDRIYVVVPLEGQWLAAQGGVFSYYEFTQPRSQRLTDEEWREKLAGGEAELPGWAVNFLLPGGQAQEVLVFRKGDAYIITEDGDSLNARDQPSLRGEVVVQLKAGEYIEVVDGPLQADGYTWWKVRLFDWSSDQETTGWAVEDQQWYVRSYRPDQ